MSTKLYSSYLIIFNIAGIAVSLLIAIENDKGGIGFGYLIISLSFVGFLSISSIVISMLLYKSKFFSELSGCLYPVIVAINIVELLLLGFLSF